MGNALSFLEDSKDKKRRGHHNARCKEKQDKFLENNEITNLEDCELIKNGSNGNTQVNKRFDYKYSLPGFNARRFAKRKPRTCPCCKELFVPVKMRRPLLRNEIEKGRDEYHTWCPYCTNKGQKYRKLIDTIGGIDMYHQILKFIEDFPPITTKTTLYDLFIIQDARISIQKNHKSIQNKIDIIIEKAWEENVLFDERKNHYEFDF